ncbi:MAG: hypothetical protein JW809_17810 [Pirellulales bacterium]|nr:hypothetical protein [Pirellulales bacterium]
MSDKPVAAQTRDVEMMTKVPTFGLRHFMAHLAPGAWCAFQVSIITIALAWYLLPGWIVLLCEPGQVAGVFLGFLAIVMCYFVGVVIRLTPVEHLDGVSVDYGLRRAIAAGLPIGARLRSAAYGVIRWALPWKCIDSWIRHLDRWPRLRRFAHAACRPLSCSEAVRLLEEQRGLPGRESSCVAPESAMAPTTIGQHLMSIRDDPIAQLVDKLEKTPDSEGNEPESSKGSHHTGCRGNIVGEISLREWLRNQAVAAIRDFDNRALETDDQKENRKKWKADWRWLNAWIWNVDRFPYPLWRIYQAYYRMPGSDVATFRCRLGPDLLETMHGEVSTKSGHAAYNRGKLWVLAKSPELAAPVCDLEAMVRMVNGFYQPLAWTAKLSFWGAVVFFLAALFTGGFSSVSQDGAVASASSRAAVVFFVFVALFAVNGFLAHLVVAGFTHLRRVETDAVYDALWILRTEPPATPS